jgi:hypothetical protein
VSLNSTSLEINTQGGKVFSVDLASLSNGERCMPPACLVGPPALPCAAGAHWSLPPPLTPPPPPHPTPPPGATKISGIAVDPANATQVVITYTDGSSQAVDSSALGGSKGLAALAYDKDANEIVATLADGTKVSGKLDDMLGELARSGSAPAAGRVRATALCSRGLYLVLPPCPHRPLPPGPTLLPCSLPAAKSVNGLALNPANASEVIITYGDGSNKALDVSALGGGKGLAGLAYDKASDSIVATLLDGTTVTGKLDDLTSGLLGEQLMWPPPRAAEVKLRGQHRGAPACNRARSCACVLCARHTMHCVPPLWAVPSFRPLWPHPPAFCPVLQPSPSPAWPSTPPTPLRS